MNYEKILRLQKGCEEKQSVILSLSLKLFFKRDRSTIFSGNIKSINSHELCRTIQVRPHVEEKSTLQEWLNINPNSTNPLLGF